MRYRRPVDGEVPRRRLFKNEDEARRRSASRAHARSELAARAERKYRPRGEDPAVGSEQRRLRYLVAASLVMMIEEERERRR